MQSFNDSIKDIEHIGVDSHWNKGTHSETKMHSIHAYPAKFPAFIADKAFEYASAEGVNVQKVADFFCGCGTVALESLLHNKHFWGCDINPVAVLIAKAKSYLYSEKQITQYYEIIKNYYNKNDFKCLDYEYANERIKYWFTEKSYYCLNKLKFSIIDSVPSGKYQILFLCLFSSILKPASKWLTQSIKPQIDPNKKEIDIWEAFDKQFIKVLSAINEINSNYNCSRNIHIQKCNFLNVKKPPSVDLIITSPPYVTSYEYADLHQLSTLWLDYASDYRQLRKGTIGSIYNVNDYDKTALNDIGKDIIEQLESNNVSKTKVASIARYYCDMENVVKKSYSMLNHSGMALFVIGDTEYNGVKVMNSEHLVQSMLDTGFSDIKIAKRTISGKLLTPYRDSSGKFTSNENSKRVYHEEFIVSGRTTLK